MTTKKNVDKPKLRCAKNPKCPECGGKLDRMKGTCFFECHNPTCRIIEVRARVDGLSRVVYGEHKLDTILAS